MSCKRCGQCCFPYSVGMDAEESARRWLTYHGLVITDIGEDRMALHGHSRCAMLVANADGTTTCAVYEDRPTICRDFVCRRATE